VADSSRRWCIVVTITMCVSLAACGTIADAADDEDSDARSIELDLGALPDVTTRAAGPQPLTTAPVSPLPGGTYVTTVGPQVTFTVDDRWDLEAMDGVQGSLLFGSYSPMDIVAPRLEWIDLTAAGARVVPVDLRGVVGRVDDAEYETWMPLPADLAQWFETESGLELGSAEQVVVGGRSATSFTFAVRDLPAGSDACVVWPCVRLLGGADWGWPVLEGDIGRMWVIDIDGHELLLQIRVQAGDADIVIPAGLEVVSSMAFGDPS
jgi:hypothetical protein